MMYSNPAYEQPRKKNPILAALTAVVAAFLIITLILIPTIKAITSKPITSYPMGTNNAQPLGSYRNILPYYITTPSGTGNP